MPSWFSRAFRRWRLLFCAPALQPAHHLVVRHAWTAAVVLKNGLVDGGQLPGVQLVVSLDGAGQLVGGAGSFARELADLLD
jgi:hypothetical protein